ncbi:MAG: preprotein translocase subunit YajC [Ruminococcaceae bacterium]|nr:preprotein translocase subunit YajC [Oscillospiraceae bacterium]MBQ7302533.1 preprotein translocase subunit YajC [Clostridia bacterium]
MFKTFLLDAAVTTGTSAGQQQELTGFQAFLANFSMPLMLILVFGLMYFFMIRPQNKKRKEEQKMRNNVRVGDEIITIGGICGRIVNVREDTLVIETSTDRSKMTIQKWALQECLTVHDTPVDNDDDDDDDED